MRFVIPETPILMPFSSKVPFAVFYVDHIPYSKSYPDLGCSVSISAVKSVWGELDGIFLSLVFKVDDQLFQKSVFSTSIELAIDEVIGGLNKTLESIKAFNAIAVFRPSYKNCKMIVADFSVYYGIIPE